MRNVQARFAVGDARATAHLAVYGPDADGVLDPTNPVAAGHGYIHDAVEQPSWHQGAWHSGSHHRPVRRAGCHRAAHHTQPYHQEQAEVPVALGRYEYGVYEGGAKVVDAIENASVMSDAAGVLVNAAPPPQRTAEISVTADIVSMTIALHME